MFGDTAAQLRAIVFFDGQNVLRSANDVFGWTKKQWDYDPRVLAEIARAEVATKIRKPVVISEIRFYTGVPSHARDKLARNYWERVFSRFHNDKIMPIGRDLRYNESGVAREKGIDLRIGLDLLRAVVDARCDVVVLFSQDTDLREAIDEAKFMLGRERKQNGYGRFVHFFARFPVQLKRKRFMVFQV